uniref:Uncharacterized protein n=1 Tax=Triticum urartu TaxID=4572 RepID=A0A8R7QUL0_TRIUA
ATQPPLLSSLASYSPPRRPFSLPARLLFPRRRLPCPRHLSSFSSSLSRAAVLPPSTRARPRTWIPAHRIGGVWAWRRAFPTAAMTTIQAPLLTVDRLRPRGRRGGAGLAEEGPQLWELSTEEDSVAVERSVRWRGSSSGGRKSAARHHVAVVAEGAARRCCLYLHPDLFTRAQ